MQDAVTIIIDRFLNFIARLFIPQSVFIVIFMLFDFLMNDFQNSLKLLKVFSSNIQAAVIMLIIVGIGWGFIVSIINMLFNQMNNGNYNGLIKSKNCLDLSNLREKVKEKLESEKTVDFKHVCNKENITDRDLYEILGNKIFSQKVGKTVLYTDKVHHLYTITISIYINLVYLIYTHQYAPIFKICSIAVLSVSLFFVGVYLGRVYYRKRNMRLYLNYLISK